MKLINKTGAIKRISALVTAIIVMLCFSAMTVNAGNTAQIGGVNYYITSSSNMIDSSKAGHLAPGDMFDAPLFNTEEFDVSYPGEGRDAYIKIENDATPSVTRKVDMTIRETPGRTEQNDADYRLNDIIDLKVEKIESNGVVTNLYTGDLTGAYDIFQKYEFSFAAGQVSNLHFTAVIKSAEIESDSELTALQQYVEFTRTYMRTKANFQVIFTLQEVIIETTTAEETTTAAPTTTEGPTVPYLTDGPGGGGGADYILPGTPLAIIPPNIVDYPEEAVITNPPPPLTNPPEDIEDIPVWNPIEDETTVADTPEPTPEIILPLITDEITDAPPALTNSPVETLKENPKTGETDPFLYGLFGMMLVIGGGILIVGVNKKRTNTTKNK